MIGGLRCANAPYALLLISPPTSPSLGGADAILGNCFRIYPTGQISKSVSSPSYKNILPSLPTQITSIVAPSCPPRGGVSRSSRTLGWDAVAAACQKTNDVACGRRSRVVLTPRRWRQVGGSHFCRRWWQTSPVTRESPEETVKTIAQGNAGCPGEPVVTTRVLSTLAHGLRVQRAPGFPCALS